MMKTILSAIGIFLFASLAIYTLRVVLLPGRVANRTLETTEGIIDQTLTAENAIYNYEWFKNRYEAIIAIDKKIEVARVSAEQFDEAAGDRKDWTFEDKQESSRLHSIVQGLESQKEDLIAEYNARSKQANRNIFKDGLIPSIIENGSELLK